MTDEKPELERRNKREERKREEERAKPKVESQRCATQIKIASISGKSVAAKKIIKDRFIGETS